MLLTQPESDLSVYEYGDSDPVASGAGRAVRETGAPVLAAASCRFHRDHPFQVKSLRGPGLGLECWPAG